MEDHDFFSEEDFETSYDEIVKIVAPDQKRKLKLKISQLTGQTLGKIFKLNPLSIVLYGSDNALVSERYSRTTCHITCGPNPSIL